MTSRASCALSLPACSIEGTDNTAPAFSRLMLLPTKACGLPRNSDTSIWSSEMPGRCVRPAMRDSESPGRTRTSSSLVGAAPATGGRGASMGAARGVVRAGAGERAGDGAVAIGAGSGAAGAAIGAGTFAGAFAGTFADEGAAAITGAADGAGACAVRALGGSNNIVYSRTSRPLDQVASMITSTKGSSTARSLVMRTTERPSARLTICTCAEGSTALYSTPAVR